MSEIRKYITSRHSDGVLLEIDYSQLEIFVLAHLSQCSALKSDLLSGVDIHAKSARRLFGFGFTKKQRKIAKQLSFQLQYGAGYKSMALSNAIPEAQAKKFIDNYYSMYPGVAEYHASMKDAVEMNKVPSGQRSKKGYPVAKSLYKSETGRIYTFVESDAPEWMANPKFPGATPVHTTFSPTKIKNYQNQGYATGDIVPLVLGNLWRELNLFNSAYNLDVVRIVNTVHDSVLFDCYNEKYALMWAKRAKKVMESAPDMLANQLGVDFTMPLYVEAAAGWDWYTMRVLDI